MKSIWTISACVFLMAAAGAEAQTTQATTTQATDEKKMEKVDLGDKVPDFTLTDIHGHSWSLHEAMKKHDAKVVVLQFMSTKCPVSLGYDDKTASTLANLVEKDVLLLGICSSHEGVEKAKDLQVWKAKKRMAYPILLDQDSRIADLMDARVTPEYFVLNSDGVLKYRGALDNKTEMDDANHINYVADAVNAVLAGREVKEDEVMAFGCTIKRKG